MFYYSLQYVQNISKYEGNQRRLFMSERIQSKPESRRNKKLAALGVGALALLPACGGKTEVVTWELEATCAGDAPLQITDVKSNNLGGGFTLSCEGDAPTSVSIVDGPGKATFQDSPSTNAHLVEVVVEDYTDNFSADAARISSISQQQTGTRVVIADMTEFERIQVTEGN